MIAPITAGDAPDVAVEHEVDAEPAQAAQHLRDPGHRDVRGHAGERLHARGERVEAEVVAPERDREVRLHGRRQPAVARGELGQEHVVQRVGPRRERARCAPTQRRVASVAEDHQRARSARGARSARRERRRAAAATPRRAARAEESPAAPCGRAWRRRRAHRASDGEQHGVERDAERQRQRPRLQRRAACATRGASDRAAPSPARRSRRGSPRARAARRTNGSCAAVTPRPARTRAGGSARRSGRQAPARATRLATRARAVEAHEAVLGQDALELPRGRVPAAALHLRRRGARDAQRARRRRRPAPISAAATASGSGGARRQVSPSAIISRTPGHVGVDHGAAARHALQRHPRDVRRQREAEQHVRVVHRRARARRGSARRGSRSGSRPRRAPRRWRRRTRCARRDAPPSAAAARAMPSP